MFAQYTHHIYDTVLDIYFAEARFYDAKYRQWMSSDPMKDGLNWYQYVGANPVTYQDPWGLLTVLINGKRIEAEYRTMNNAEVLYADELLKPHTGKMKDEWDIYVAVFGPYTGARWTADGNTFIGFLEKYTG